MNKGRKHPDHDLTIEQISSIGMNAVMRMSVQETYGLVDGALCYGTGNEQERLNLHLLDLEAVLEPHFRRSVVISEGIAWGNIVVGDKEFLTGAMEGSNLFPPRKGSIPAVHEFIGYFMAEIRRIICKQKTSSRTLGHTTTGEGVKGTV